MSVTELEKKQITYPAVVYVPEEDGRVSGLVRLPNGLFVNIKQWAAEEITPPKPPLGYVFEGGLAIDFGLVSRIEECAWGDVKGVKIVAEKSQTSVFIPIPLLDVARAVDEVNKDGHMFVTMLAAGDGRPTASITLTHRSDKVRFLPPARNTAEHE